MSLFWADTIFDKWMKSQFVSFINIVLLIVGPNPSEVNIYERILGSKFLCTSHLGV